MCSTAKEADLGTEMHRVGGDSAQRLRGRPEQDVVNHRLVLKPDHRDLVGHGEHHVEIRHVEQFRLTVLEPSEPVRDPWHFGQFLLRHEL